jgi:hypothetical protein
MNKESQKFECSHTHPSIVGELACHLPYSIVAVAFSLAIVSFLSLAALWANIDHSMTKKGLRILFHSFHFMHLVFAAAGTLVTFFRFSNNIPRACILGLISPSFFCVLSDAVLPYIAGRALGFNIHFHICFLHEFKNIVPFLLVGIAAGLLSRYNHHTDQMSYALTSHASHILVSSLASTFYLVSSGLNDWHLQIGFVFLFLIIAVVVPCTLSDIIVPMTVARLGKTDEQQQHFH